MDYQKENFIKNITPVFGVNNKHKLLYCLIYMNLCVCGYIKDINKSSCCLYCYKKKGHGPLCKKITRYVINKNEKYYFETSDSGIGDRIGQIITICCFCKCFELENDIVIFWKNSYHRNYDLKEVKEYINFPKKCIITDDKTFLENRKPLYLFNNIKKWNHSYDLIPESSYLLLIYNYNWGPCKLSFLDFLNIHKNISSEINIDNKILKGNKLEKETYTCIHIRRDDKLLFKNQNFLPNNLFLKITNEYSNESFLIISDDKIPDSIKNINNCYTFNNSEFNDLEKVLLDLYILLNSTKIISVIYSDGWSSFSYVCSRISNCCLMSYVRPNTRYSNVCNFVNTQKLDMFDIEYIN